MKFRKIPSVVEAVRVPMKKGDEPEWVTRAVKSGRLILFHGGASMVTRSGAVVIATDGDWVVQDIHSELYPVTDKVMMLDYDPITKENERG